MINPNFMLKGTTAELLYNEFAKDAPVYDYHCHLSAKEIYEDEEFSDIAIIWLKHDHYKWRAMRYAGVPEKYVSGDGSWKEKFKYWAKTCERLIGSPLHHWANMELKVYFGINETLKESNADSIYDRCNKIIAENRYSPVKMINTSNVKLICTTDDPIDDLSWHKLLMNKNELDFKVLPSFRPDKAFNLRNEGFIEYIGKLEACTGIQINSYKNLMKALSNRIEYFRNVGCLLSDHSLESLEYYPTTVDEVEEILSKRLTGKAVSIEEAEKFKIFALLEVANEYKKAGLSMQLHLGAMRNTNEALFKRIGVDAGFDIMNDFRTAEPLAKILNEMNLSDGLPKTMIYTLNTKDNLVFSSLPHCFPEDGVAGKIQFGVAWWFNDHKEGITDHLRSIANQGMLADFIGMLTDSRSFLSYVRHDYFRRILCSFIGEIVDNGEFEFDKELLGNIIEGICYKNIREYLKLN